MGNKDICELIDAADMMTLVGTPQQPGFMLRSMVPNFEKLGGNEGPLRPLLSSPDE